MKDRIYSNRAFKLYADNRVTGYPLLDIQAEGGCYSCTNYEDQLDAADVRELIGVLSAWLVEADANKAAWDASLMRPLSEGER